MSITENRAYNATAMIGGVRAERSIHSTVPVRLTLGLLVLTFFLTYVVMSYTHGLKVKKVQDQFLMDIQKQTAKAACLENQVHRYRSLVQNFSKRGRKRPLGTFTITAYDPVESCKPFDDGITATLIPAGMGIAAVDPRVIPYGSVLYIPELGRYFLASDTGAAMRRGNGKNIDILMPTVQNALKFGRKSMKVDLIDLSRS